MRNKILKALVFDKQVLLLFVDNTPLINEIISLNKHNHRLLNLALGKTVSGISLLSATLKGEQRISATVTMSNPKYKIFADTDAHGNVRGYPSQGFLKAEGRGGDSIKDFIGHKASIRIIKGSHMNQFTGITDMPNQNIDDDLSHYFKQSEQTETIIETNLALGEKNTILYSYAMYAQLLPGAPNHLLNEIKDKMDTNSILFKKLKDMDIKQIQEQLNKYFSCSEIIGQSQVQFSCGCSKEMFYGLLHSLENKDLMAYIHAYESIETCCHICGRTYLFYPSEIQTFYERRNSMTKYWKVGELSELTGLSIRTLRYYDQIKLFSPSEYTASGHRRYTHTDLQKLHKILVLKQMGLPLEEVQKIIANEKSNSILETINKQIDRIHEDIKVHQQLLRQLQEVKGELVTKKNISMNELTTLFELMKMNRSMYFTDSQLAEMRNYYRQVEENTLKEVEKEFQLLLTKSRTEKEQRTSPKDKIVQELAIKWKSIAYSVSYGNPEIERNAESFYADNPNAAMHYGLDADLYLYIQEALKSSE
jgi:molecular chaperone Hsp33